MSSPTTMVIGGGPAGSSAAYWLARSGHQVTLVEKKEFPRNKTCGDGLTPRAIRQLLDMGFDFDVPEFHTITGLRSYAGDELMLEMDWPDHSRFPNWGASPRRRDLDQQVARLAEKQGVQILEKTEAKPVIEDGASLVSHSPTAGRQEAVSPDMVIIADGSLNRFGRLGTSRRKDYPNRSGPARAARSPRYGRHLPREPTRSPRRFGRRHPGLRVGVPAGGRAGQRGGGIAVSTSSDGSTSTPPG